MNECATSWIVFGPFELDHIVARLLGEVPPLSGSIADEAGFAQSRGQGYRWICLDAEMGSAVFIFPASQSQFEADMRGPLYALEGGLSVMPSIYGNVDDRLWITLGGAGHRVVVPAQDFLQAAA